MKYYTPYQCHQSWFCDHLWWGSPQKRWFPLEWHISWPTWPWVINKWDASTFYSLAHFANAEYAWLLSQQYTLSNRLWISLSIVPSFVRSFINATKLWLPLLIDRYQLEMPSKTEQINFDKKMMICVKYWYALLSKYIKKFLLHLTE